MSILHSLKDVLASSRIPCLTNIFIGLLLALSIAFDRNGSIGLSICKGTR